MKKARPDGILLGMTEVTQILSLIEHGDSAAAEQLMPLVYDELRNLAAAKLAHEKPGQTLQATALVHEAYLRLVDVDKVQRWDSRGHFFAAAAESMRRILVDNARRKKAQVHGGDRQRVDLDGADLISRATPDRIVALDEALSKLAVEDPACAKLIAMRLFAGLSMPDAAAALKMSRASAYRHWTYARAWLRAEIADE